jgi:DNA polymerase-3 subunit epsilon
VGKGHGWQQVSLEDLIGAVDATLDATVDTTANATANANADAPVITTEAAAGLGGTSLAMERDAGRPAAVVDAASPGAPGEASGPAAVVGGDGAAGAQAGGGDPGVAAGSGGVGAAVSPGGAAASPPAGQQAATSPDPGASLPRLISPRQLLILDTETTALSPQQGSCIEVGAVLFDVASRAILMQVSFLLPCQDNPALAINGIPAAVTRLPQPWQSGLACFQAMLASADAVLAHNVSFDRQWFGQAQLPPLTRPWICSMEDIRWPADRRLQARPSVRDLALAYGVPVWAAHRALTDCTYLVQVLQRCPDLELLLQQALEPRRLVRARVSYDERQLAKEAGFRWNEPVRGAWSRRLSEREIAALPFAVDPIEQTDPHNHPAGAA